jgi:DNA-binding response OmpR family regulator
MKTIIIYDADQNLVDILCQALELEGFQALGINDGGTDFLALAYRIKPQLVLFDFIHKGKFCIKWCRLIKFFYPNLPVIALSCNNKISEIFSEHGFDDSIRKPFDLEHLYATVRKYT